MALPGTHVDTSEEAKSDGVQEDSGGCRPCCKVPTNQSRVLFNAERAPSLTSVVQTSQHDAATSRARNKESSAQDSKDGETLRMFNGLQRLQVSSVGGSASRGGARTEGGIFLSTF